MEIHISINDTLPNNVSILILPNTMLTCTFTYARVLLVIINDQCYETVHGSIYYLLGRLISVRR